jgi:hypothetical protein
MKKEPYEGKYTPILTKDDPNDLTDFELMQPSDCYIYANKTMIINLGPDLKILIKSRSKKQRQHPITLAFARRKQHEPGTKKDTEAGGSGDKTEAGGHPTGPSTPVQHPDGEQPGSDNTVKGE